MTIPWDILSGGVTGLVGTIWSSYNQRKLKQLEMEERQRDRDHELKTIDAETKATIAEAEASIRATEAQIQGQIQVAETEAYTATLVAANKPSLTDSLAAKLFAATGKIAFIAHGAGVLICILLGLVDTIKGLARPAITAYLLGLSTWISIQAWKILASKGAALTASEASGIVCSVIDAVLYLTITAVTWWFGDRMAAKGAARMISR